MGDMFRPDSGHLQALVKIQILEIIFKMQCGIPIADDTGA